MPNTLLTISMITREAARVLVNELGFGKRVNRQYDNKFAQSGAKIGYSLNVRKPPRYITSSGATLVVNDSTETQATVTLSQEHVGLEFTAADMALSIDDFSKRFIKPAVSALANKIDFDGTLLYRDVYNLANTVGAGNPTQLSQYLAAKKFLTQGGTPQSDRVMCINSAQTVAIIDALKGLFNSTGRVADQYEKGAMSGGPVAGFDWYEDENMRLHTFGTWGPVGNVLVVAGGQTGSTLSIDGLTATTGTCLRGDVFTLAGVYMVNPQNRQSTGELQRFVVTSNKTASGGGAITDLPISPPITVSGKDQTVTASPADNAPVTIQATAVSAEGHQGLAFHPDAFTLATADMEIPKGVDFADRVSSPELGISLSVIRQYDIREGSYPCRIDSLYGWSTLRPELACRISN